MIDQSLMVGKSADCPFDSIRRFDQEGSEYWSARELMKWLGYVDWRNAEKAIARASKSLVNQICNLGLHIVEVNDHSPSNGLGVQVIKNYHLSRLACYTVAMNSDPDKEMVALAQGYFAIKTREAELVIPAQNDRLRELELENENLKLKDKMAGRQDFRINAYGLATTLLLEGKSDTVIEIDREISTVIDPRSNSSYSGQTLPEIVKHVKKMTGKRFASGADLERHLEQRVLRAKTA